LGSFASTQGTGYNGGASGGPLTVQASLSSGATAAGYPTVSITVTSGAITGCTLVTFGAGFKDTTTVLTVTSADMVTAGFAAGGTGFSVPVATLTSGNSNVAIGYQASYYGTTANNNVTVGYNAGFQTTTGTNNVYIGTSAAQNSTTGFNNTYIGYNTSGSALTNQNEIVIGSSAVGLGSNTTVIGRRATTGNYSYGQMYQPQPAITALTATATLTIAQMLTDIITVTSATAVTLTLPTGTLTDAGIIGGILPVRGSFDWSIINLGSAVGAVSIANGTDHTFVGGTVAIGTSSMFRTVKTATNTFISYLIS
jgi:hypothetical protein